jgi:multicomponent K+:H+ antiporter subunit D
LNAWFYHLQVVPIVTPLLIGALILLIPERHAARVFAATGSVLVQFLASLTLLYMTTDAMPDMWQEGVGVYNIGGWPAPFGIVLVVDRLAAMMLTLTSLVGLAALIYSIANWDRVAPGFHSMFQFLLMGLNGAFLTGDLFNLFVFFEVLLASSYGLMLHGSGPSRVKGGLHYIAVNLVASFLFLIGVAMIYGMTGTLNMGDLAEHVSQLDIADRSLFEAGAAILGVAFFIKAGIWPLNFWLPATYTAASAPVAAVFALMTKVGVYAIVRVHGVVFGDGAGESARLVEPWLLPLALASSLLAVLGALAAQTLPRLVAWLTIASVGTILAALGLFTTAAWSAAIYYTVQSTLVIAALFLLSELVGAQRGDVGDRLEPAGPVAQPALLGTMLLLLAASVIGLPPMPGFLGKLMILQAADGAAMPWLWGTVLLVGFLSLLGLARAGALLFWAVEPGRGGGSAGASPRLLMATVSLVVAVVVLAGAAGPVKRYADAAAVQLLDREGAARAVLGGGPGARADAVRRYRPEDAKGGKP